MVFEFCEYDLKQYMKKQGGQLTQIEIMHLLRQILEATAFCHANGVMHRDLKPQNILVDKYGNLKIIDFGLARAFNVPLRDYTHEVVTLWYRSPEVLLGEQTYTPAIDTWSIGVIMAEMSEKGRPLLPGDSEIDQLFRTFRLVGTPDERLWPEALSMKDFKPTFPKWRPQELSMVCQNFDSQGLDLLRKLLCLDPRGRLTCREALAHPYFQSFN